MEEMINESLMELESELAALVAATNETAARLAVINERIRRLTISYNAIFAEDERDLITRAEAM